jgi:hypothetical protein
VQGHADAGLRADAGTLSVAGSALSGNGANDVAAMAGVMVSVTDSMLTSASGYGLYADRPASLTLTGSALSNHTAYPVYLALGGAPPALSVSGNTVAANAVNGLALTGTLGAAGAPAGLTLPLLPGLPYVVPGGLAVAGGSTLTLPAGLVVKFANTGSYLDVSGTLRAEGVAGAPVVLTSLHDDAVGGDTNNNGVASAPGPGQWGAVIARAGSTVALEGAELRYGGSGAAGSAGGLFNQGGAVSVVGSGLSRNAGFGLYQSGGTAALADVTLSGNGAFGLAGCRGTPTRGCGPTPAP